MSLWVVPIAVAGVGALALLVATRRAAGTLASITSSIARTRGELTPLIGSLRREMSRAASRRRPGDRDTRQ